MQRTGNNGAAACLESISFMAQNSGPNNWEAALATKKSGSQSLRNTTVGWNNIPFADLLALADAACGAAPPSAMQRTGNNGASSPFFPHPYTQTDRNLEQPNSHNAFLMNQNYTISSMQTNNSKCPPQIPQYGFPIPYHATYDLNSPRKIADADSNGATFQFAPVTPDQGRKAHGNQHLEVANILLDGSPCQKSNKLQNGTSPVGNNAFEPYNEEPQLKPVMDSSSDAPESLSQQVVDLLSAALPTPSKDNKEPKMAKDDGIDLNKTPQQKTRRRKHRPRVVIEGKPKRGPKATVKQDGTKEMPAKKRKYTRRNGINASKTPSADVGEVTDQMPHVKSCKRALNFDCEGQERDGSHGLTLSHQRELPQSSLGISSSRQAFNVSSESKAQDLMNETNCSSGIKSNMNLSEGLEVIVERSTAGIAFDLNHSFQMLDECILHENLLPTRKDQQLENCEVLTRNIHCTVTSGICQDSRIKDSIHSHQQIHKEQIGGSSFPITSPHNNDNVVPSMLQSEQHSVSQSQSKLKNTHYVLLADTKQAGGSKRGHSDNYDVSHLQSMNMTGTHVNSVHFNQIFQRNEYQSSNYPGMHFPEICKKRRTEKSQNSIRVRASSSVVPMVNNRQAVTVHSVNDGTFTWVMSDCDNRSAPKNSTKDAENLKNGVSSSIHNVYSQSMGMVCSMETIPDKLLRQKEASRKVHIEKSLTSEFMLTFGQVERNTKKRSKVPTRVRDFKSLAAIFNCNALPLTTPKAASTSGDGQGIEILHITQKCTQSPSLDKQAKMAKEQSNKELAIVNPISYSDINELRRQEYQATTYGYCQSLAMSRGPTEVSQQFNSPIDELTQKLNHLSLKDENNRISAQEQNALVPFVHGQMVPYEGLFDPTKKRRPRPKVDLDPETDRVWKLLMGKEDRDSVEGRDVDKEKWWEEERRIFRGRVDSFIARMHLIQGDRRFSQWNGSVVDSVIGVFLTQNVSDHLSSSAFMSLAARFPLKSTSNKISCNEEKANLHVEEREVVILDQDDIEWQNKTPKGPFSVEGSVTSLEIEYVKEKKTGNNKDPCDITESGSREGISQVHLVSPMNSTDTLNARKGYQISTVVDRGAQEELVSSQNSEVSSQNHETYGRTMNVMTGSASFVEPDNKRTLDDVVSSQNSINSFVPQTDELVKSYSDSNSEEEDPTTRNSFSGSFVELLQMAGTKMLHEYSSQGSGNLTLNLTSGLSQSEVVESIKRSTISQIDAVEDPFSILPSNSQFPNTPVPSSNYYLHVTPDSGVLEIDCAEITGVENKYFISSATETIGKKDEDDERVRISPIEETTSDNKAQQTLASNPMVAPAAKQSSLSSKQPMSLLISTGQEGSLENHSLFCNQHQGESNKTFQFEVTPVKESGYFVDSLVQRSSVVQQGCLNKPNSSQEPINVMETACSVDKQKQIEEKVAESNAKEQVYYPNSASSGTTTNTLKTKVKLEKEKKKTFDWDSLRKGVLCNGTKRERSNDTMDSLDWEAVRCADVNEIAKTIKERGMNNMLAERIKDFLNRLVREHGSIDLEWLRDIPPDKTKEYLLSVRGLGLKSVECVRLLTLHHLAFPVDTNVGRIAVRLGWVPLQPLPESLQLHLLELYPVLETIQKYLWPRLCTLDQRTLYELHYQMITFGKVFCTKSKPNCNACPMRAECKHFASAFASARLALPGPEQKGIVSSAVTFTANHDPPASINHNPPANINPMPLPLPDVNVLFKSAFRTDKHEPIIEEPATPESHCRYTTESDIEDAFYEDPDEIPTIKLNIEDFALNLQNYMQENMELQEGDMSKALVALTPEAASLPTPKLKNVNRLRTEHQVYELPDSHPLLEGVEKRVPGDVCSYLLAIWTPGETAESIQPPERCCSSQTSGKLCNEATCFSCNSIREANSQTVRGTLLIPCKTAMRGSFPLNGTYFQVNEVFADHESSLNPIDVPRDLIWNLPRRTVYFGTSIPTIFKGQTTEEIQNCFWRGYVCVRGFDQKTRAPRPLMARLHFPASKMVRTKTKASEE